MVLIAASNRSLSLSSSCIQNTKLSLGFFAFFLHFLSPFEGLGGSLMKQRETCIPLPSLCMLSSLPCGGGLCDIVGEDIWRGTLRLNTFDNSLMHLQGMGTLLLHSEGLTLKHFHFHRMSLFLKTTINIVNILNVAHPLRLKFHPP